MLKSNIHSGKEQRISILRHPPKNNPQNRIIVEFVLRLVYIVYCFVFSQYRFECFTADHMLVSFLHSLHHFFFSNLFRFSWCLSVPDINFSY